MAVLVFRIIPVLRPLLQLTQPADPRGEQAIAGDFERPAKVIVNVQHVRGADTVCEQIIDERHIYGRGDADASGLPIRDPESVLGRG